MASFGHIQDYTQANILGVYMSSTMEPLKWEREEWILTYIASHPLDHPTILEVEPRSKSYVEERKKGKWFVLETWKPYVSMFDLSAKYDGIVNEVGSSARKWDICIFPDGKYYSQALMNQCDVIIPKPLMNDFIMPTMVATAIGFFLLWVVFRKT